MNRKIGLRIVFFFLMFILLFSDATDADISDSEVSTGNTLTATTLDFSQNQTSNNQPLSVFFNVMGLVPNGFDIKAVRIKKDGKMDFNYRITSVKTAGNDNFCQALTVVFLKNWTIKYEGLINELLIDDLINENGISDWVILIKLDNNSQELTQKECQFDFIFKTWKTDPNETSGFYDEETLTNRVTSGSWAYD